jgi:SAM-dependent methyltransferase
MLGNTISRRRVEIEEYEKTYNLEDSYWWFVGKRRIAQNLIEEFVPLNQREAILDVGCGTGATMCFLDHYGRAYGMDISETALCFCLPFADDSFSLITAFDVLYHREVVDDLTALREFHRVCKKGGSVLISEPAFDFLWSGHDLAYHSKRRVKTGASWLPSGQALLQQCPPVSIFFRLQDVEETLQALSREPF